MHKPGSLQKMQFGIIQFGKIHFNDGDDLLGDGEIGGKVGGKIGGKSVTYERTNI